MTSPSSLNKLTKAQLIEATLQANDQSLLMESRLVDLELALEDRDWMQIYTEEGETELSQQGIVSVIQYARAAYLSNPLINHAVNVQANYIFAQGMNITTKGDTKTALEPLLADERNKAELFGHQARWLKEVGLQLEANIFFVFFTDETTGSVRIGTIPPNEILAGKIITNPDDRMEPHYYKRVWQRRVDNLATGGYSWERVEEYYPDFRYEPETKPATIGNKPVHWDRPVYHVRVGGLPGYKFGVPEVYSALDWAKAVRRDLEDYATLRRSLARFAWRVYTKGGAAGVSAAKAKLESAISSTAGTLADRNPAPVAGAAWIANEGRTLEPIKTAGATISPEEGRRLWYMISAGTGIPEPILAGSADSGSWATAKSLDRPTELQMRNRQTMWVDVHTTIFNYVLKKKQAAGTYTATMTDGMLLVTDDAGEEVPPELVISFPNILERDTKALVDATVQAATLDGKASAGLFELEMLTRMLLEALGEPNVEKMMAELYPEGEAGPAAGVIPTGEPVQGPPPLQAEELAAQVAEVAREVRAMREDRKREQEEERRAARAL